MGMEAPSGDKMVAHVLCNGGCKAKDNFEYRGVTDCLAATKVCGGNSKACRYGCFGFGSCVAACKFDAIHVENGVAVVDKEKCTNCGACREACPHHLIVEVPYKQKVFVNCSNKDKGPAVTKVYRLEKIKKITGLDLREFDHAIVFKVAMMVKMYLDSLNNSKY